MQTKSFAVTPGKNGEKEFKIHKFTLFSLVLTTHLKIGISLGKQSFFFLMSKTQFKKLLSLLLPF